MNKKTIITILLALVAMAGQAQIHYRLEGNIGRPDLIDTLSIVENRGFEKDGTILARGLRGKDIDKKLEEIFNK